MNRRGTGVSHPGYLHQRVFLFGEQKRTHWHDLLGRHCPRFGLDKVVAVPLPKPVDFKPQGGTFEYKLSLSFNGDRFHTPWLSVIGKKINAVPMIEVDLVRSGSQLRSVRAKVVPAPGTIGDTHKQLLEEFGNIELWPKHLLIQYKWTSVDEIDVDRGLYMLFGGSLLLTTIASLSVVNSYQAKLAQLFSDMASEEFTNSQLDSVRGAPASAIPASKAD
mmetsp:Transcript_26159/g.46522  ORF Transcript_26159/g.46522 Transcript_26159/m.46522 type:complete len:219 (-) Transcript_26159:98-754(-)